MEASPAVARPLSARQAKHEAKVAYFNWEDLVQSVQEQEKKVEQQKNTHEEQSNERKVDMVKLKELEDRLTHLRTHLAVAAELRQQANARCGKEYSPKEKSRAKYDGNKTRGKSPASRGRKKDKLSLASETNRNKEPSNGNAPGGEKRNKSKGKRGVIPSPYAAYTIKEVRTSTNDIPRTMLAWNNKKGEEAGLSFLKVCNNDEEFEKALKNLELFTENSRIVKLEDSDKSSRVLVMENLGDISLASYLQSKEKDTADRDLKALQIMKAVEAIHHQGMAHLDLKPTNIMLIHSAVGIKIIGLHRMCGENSKQIQKITPLYCAPELAVASVGGKLNDISAQRSQDIFSLGLVLYEMYNKDRQKPMFSDPVKALQQLCEYACNPSHSLPYKQEDTQPIINRMLSRNPQDRPSIDFLVECFDKSYTRNSSLLIEMKQEIKQDLAVLYSAVTQLSRDLSLQVSALSSAMEDLMIENKETTKCVQEGFVSLEKAMSESNGQITQEVKKAAQRATNSLVHVFKEHHQFPRLLLIQPTELTKAGVVKQSLARYGWKDYYDIVFMCEQPLLCQSSPASLQVGVQSEFARLPCTGSCNHVKKADIFSAVNPDQKPHLSKAIQALITHENKTNTATTSNSYDCSSIVSYSIEASVCDVCVVLTSEQMCQEVKAKVDMSSWTATVDSRASLRHPTIPVFITGPTLRKLAPLLKVVAALLKVACVTGSLGSVPIPCGDSLVQFADAYLGMIENSIKVTPSEAVPAKLKGYRASKAP